ncbi:MAG: hypothetical protein M1840_005625 [Geoglossum simile]|nr:MAG: hypothetical protein M1840_005625 [Geoglossum simile]
MAAAGTASPTPSSSPSLSFPSYSPITQQHQWLLEAAPASPQHSPNPIPEPSNIIPSSLWPNGPRSRKPSKKKAKAEAMPATAKEIRAVEAATKQERRATIKAAKEEEAAVNAAARQRRREAAAVTKALEAARKARKKGG